MRSRRSPVVTSRKSVGGGSTRRSLHHPTGRTCPRYGKKMGSRGVHVRGARSSWSSAANPSKVVGGCMSGCERVITEQQGVPLVRLQARTWTWARRRPGGSSGNTSEWFHRSTANRGPRGRGDPGTSRQPASANRQPASLRTDSRDGRPDTLMMSRGRPGEVGPCGRWVDDVANCSAGCPRHRRRRARPGRLDVSTIPRADSRGWSPPPAGCCL